VPAKDILEARYSDAFRELMAFQAERAEKFYDQAFAQLPAIDRKAQRPGLVMAAIYRTLLREIAADGFLVLDRRTSLTPLRKVWLPGTTWFMRAERVARPSTVAVIGAGYAGLACAVELARAGVHVTVFERSHTLGGRARVVHKDHHWRVDNGQHILAGRPTR
jgi:hypothetical protein